LSPDKATQPALQYFNYILKKIKYKNKPALNIGQTKFGRLGRTYGLTLKMVKAMDINSSIFAHYRPSLARAEALMGSFFRQINVGPLA